MVFPFFLLTVLWSMISASCSSLYTAWICLEINSYVFVPIFLYNKWDQLPMKVSIWKYFVIQSLSSVLFVLCVVLPCDSLSNIISPVSTFVWIAMFYKMGVPPFQGWLLEVCERSSWVNFYILNVVQKLPPLVVMMAFDKANLVAFLFLWTLFFMYFSVKSSYYYPSSRQFFVYSSIMNLGWMVYAIFVGKFLTFLIFFVYSYLMFAVLLRMGTKENLDFGGLFGNNPDRRFSMFILVMSLMGMPPLLGFFPKVLTLIQGDILVFGFIIVCTILFMYVYLKLFVSMILFRGYANKDFIKYTLIGDVFTYGSLFLNFFGFFFFLN
uniref:NADH-ubiquinone oxidoreductase chain 2 n=1 Tax=Falcolipeurus suturalis TaxID=2839002 RepID=A0A8F8YT68_9NEOP|nr:NADH dehydrogenase subunit 2 [Falcolipeurus suturalis]